MSDKVQTIPTCCNACGGQTGVLAHVKDGQVIKLEPNSENPIGVANTYEAFMAEKGRGARMCPKGLAAIKQLYDPDRLIKPRQRIGKDKWQEISWDNALDLAAEKLEGLKAKYGPEALLWFSEDHSFTHIQQDFCRAYGTPNYLNHANLCDAARKAGFKLTLGDERPIADIANAKYIFLLGWNPLAATKWAYLPAAFISAIEAGAKLMIEKKKDQFKIANLDIQTLYDGVFYKLFEHLPDSNKQKLTTQYRMHPCIGSMISEVFYGNEIQNGIRIEDRLHPINSYKDLAIVWINTANCIGKYEQKIHIQNDHYTFRNYLEVKLVKEQLKKINEEIKLNENDVGVITPYSAQKTLISKTIQTEYLNNLGSEIPVNSVDAFQGGQKDIVIYSTVRSSSEHSNIGFLKEQERLNVAFSRAKRLLIIIGDIDQLNNNTIDGNKFPQIIRYIKTHNDNCKIIDFNEVK